MRPESKFEVAGGARILRALGMALKAKMRDSFSLPQLGWDSRFVDGRRGGRVPDQRFGREVCPSSSAIGVKTVSLPSAMQTHAPLLRGATTAGQKKQANESN
jgi:hypothetical protein